MLKSELLTLLLRTLAIGYLGYYVAGRGAARAWFAVTVLALHTFLAWSAYFYRRGRAAAPTPRIQSFRGD